MTINPVGIEVERLRRENERLSHWLQQADEPVPRPKPKPKSTHTLSLAEQQQD